MYTRWLFGSVLALGGCAGRIESSSGDTEVVRVEHRYVNAYLVLGERVVVVDSGRPGSTARILAALRRAGREPEDIAMVVLTHGHADHAGSAAELRAALGVPIAAGRGDAAMVERGHNDPLHPTGGPGRRILPFIDPEFPAFTADVWIDASFDLRPYGIEGSIEPVAGHTPGSLAVVLADGRVLVGDLVRGRFAARRRPVQHYFHDSIPGAHEALSELLRTAKVVLPGHGGPLEATDVRAWLSTAAAPRGGAMRDVTSREASPVDSTSCRSPLRNRASSGRGCSTLR